MSNRNLRACNAHLTFGPGQKFGNRVVRYPERDGERKQTYYQAMCQVCGVHSTATRDDVMQAVPGRCGCKEPEDVKDPNMDAMLAEPEVKESPLVQKHTMEEIISMADKRGWYMPILYEMDFGKLWHARFEPRELPVDPKTGKVSYRTRDSVSARTAHDAVAKAYEEIDNPGNFENKRRDAAVEKWAAIRLARGEEPLPQPGGDSAARLKALLRANSDLAFRFAEAMDGAIKVRREIAAAEVEAVLSMDDGEDEL